MLSNVAAPMERKGSNQQSQKSHLHVRRKLCNTLLQHDGLQHALILFLCHKTLGNLAVAQP
jgi:hypothetical protein